MKLEVRKLKDTTIVSVNNDKVIVVCSEYETISECLKRAYKWITYSDEYD